RLGACGHALRCEHAGQERAEVVEVDVRCGRLRPVAQVRVVGVVAASLVGAGDGRRVGGGRPRGDGRGHQPGSPCRAYASTMSWTILWRTTSRPVRRTNVRSSTPVRIASTSSRPDRPPGTSTWVTSPVMTALDPNPI